MTQVKWKTAERIHLSYVLCKYSRHRVIKDTHYSPQMLRLPHVPVLWGVTRVTTACLIMSLASPRWVGAVRWAAAERSVVFVCIMLSVRLICVSVMTTKLVRVLLCMCVPISVFASSSSAALLWQPSELRSMCTSVWEMGDCSGSGTWLQTYKLL